ncbi:putative non-specific serine/threonine protein kinase [Helianthus annuus]|nr:putative non-specific serine/threonine protein kinase [Helianthus annuus]
MISDLHRPSLIFVSSQVQLSHFHLILSVSSSVLKIQILIDEHVEREILNHRSLRHPNIIRFKELKVSYQWKPARCSYCKVFGHSDQKCKNSPSLVKEPAANTTPAASKPNSADVGVTGQCTNTSQPQVNLCVDPHAESESVDVTRKSNKSNQKQNSKPKNPGNSKKGNRENASASGTKDNGKKSPADHPAHSVNPAGIQRVAERVAERVPTGPTTRSASRKGKAPSGFNFSRAVNGIQQKTQSSTSSTQKNKSHMDIDTPPPVCTLNRFSILDVEASAKCGFLVEEDSDLYPNDPFNQAQNNSSAAGTSTSGRVLPKWNMAASNSMSNRDGEIEDMEDSDDDNGYDYGISQAQKDAIRKRLTSKSQTVLAEVANNWEPGERDYFEDLCMELGLDPDFCIEDVAEDVSETARFFSRLQKDPVVAKPISRK